MDAQSLLLNRHSQARLTAPGPTDAQLELLLQAALQAPDHAGLHPYEFMIMRGTELDRLGQLFRQAAAKMGKSAAEQTRYQHMPLRAPMVVVVISRVQAHPKVPPLEQQLCAGCAVLQMQLMAQTQGLGGIWRTGELAYDETVCAGLGMNGDEGIIGFLYLGTPVAPTFARTRPQWTKFVRSWA